MARYVFFAYFRQRKFGCSMRRKSLPVAFASVLSRNFPGGFQSRFRTYMNIGVLSILFILVACHQPRNVDMPDLDTGSEYLLPFSIQDSVNSGDFSWLGEEDTLLRHFTNLLQKRYQIEDEHSAREWVDQMNQAGVYAFVNGHTAQGLSLFLDALEVSMEFGIEEPYTQANLAMLYATVQDYDKAWELSEQSLHMFEEDAQYEEALLMLGNRLTCAMGASSVSGVEWCLEKLDSETYDTLPMACFSQCRARMFLGLQRKDYAEALHWAKASLHCGPNSVDTVAFYASVFQDIAMAFTGLEAYETSKAQYDAAQAAYDAQTSGLEIMRLQLQALEDTRTALQKRERALTLALDALSAAAQTLTEAYGPRLTAPAGRYLAALTGGQFDGLVLQDGQVLTAHECVSGLQRPLEQLSRGTADQVWLSLRLALTGLLLPPAAPLILDDALLTFDSGRTAAALQQLRREGRQILLFSCRKLEESS